MTAVSAFGVLLDSCREISSSNSSQGARTVSRYRNLPGLFTRWVHWCCAFEPFLLVGFT